MIVAPSFNFTKKENRILKPLKEAHKRQGTYWEKAYQAVKHDRYASLYKGTVKAFIHALAALYLLNIYYRNDSWITKYQDITKDDYSLGSTIFAVAPPANNHLWHANSPISSESPYVVKYRDSDYQRIEEIRQKNPSIECLLDSTARITGTCILRTTPKCRKERSQTKNHLYMGTCQISLKQTNTSKFAF